MLTGFGGHAEQAVASAATTIALEGALAGLSPLLAAATACNGATAVGTLRGAARLAEGERVLVLGAAGALGALLGDLARSYGAGLVVGAAGTPQRAALAAGRGYHRALTYGELESQAMELTDGRGFDVVVDPIGGPLRERIRPLLAVLGRHVVIGDAADRDTSMAANQVWYDSYSLAGYNLGALIGRRPDLFRAQFAEALRLVADGTLRPEVEQIGWDAVAEAHRRLEGRSAEVKYVLRTA
ncbi:zinc-binding dehydrogenase [Kitasatospora sp. MBT63]|uniref:zinc-binding dehydrogenase n=1 Tax=Kitasatospora sp. MBT63 TaxID=1444768 RepID=UPI00068F0C9B|nr:zinc-binding dehydrogenase [Kitasatospora sp. MBT63]